MSEKPSPAAIVADLQRATALFQARTIAMHLGAPMPDSAAFRRDPADRK